ncbi:MAG: hypothetical protein CME72_11615 [Halomonadaceae bacterium]|nr:hypothetical protein [Halomonadaceae bacterium]
MYIRALAVAALVAIPILAAAQSTDESWTPSMRSEFRKGCAIEMERAGVNSSKAWQYCDCITDSSEEEFGLAGFGYLAASGDRNMPEITRRSEDAMRHCFE